MSSPKHCECLFDDDDNAVIRCKFHADIEDEFRQIKKVMAQIAKDRDEAFASSTSYRHRASKAEAECAEWKKRFDLLLARSEVKPLGND